MGSRPPLPTMPFPAAPPVRMMEVRTPQRQLSGDDVGTRATDDYSGLADSYRIGWMGGLANQFERLNTGRRVEGFDPFAAIPTGYEEYADAFGDATNPDQIEVIRRQIDSNIAVRARRESRGFGSTLLSDLGSAVLDPTNLVASPALIGRGAVRGALLSSSIFGTLNAATEVVRDATDPTATPEELVMGVGAGYILPGLIGGGIGAMRGRAPTRQLGPVITQQIRSPVGGDMASLPVRSSIGTRARPQTRNGPGSRNHQGLDIPMPGGTPIVAPLDGTVTRNWRSQSGGNVVEVDHGNGLVMRYMHMRESSPLQPGQRVRQGAQLGEVGSTGRSTGNHLHWEARLNGRVIDPRTIGERRVQSVVGDDAGPGGANLGGVLAIAEGLDPPRNIDMDGRSVRVVMGPTGMVDAEGNAVLAAYRPARVSNPADEAGFGVERADASHPVVRREADADDMVAQLDAIDASLTRAAGQVEDLAARAGQLGAREAAPVAPATLARARLEAVGDGDALFFGGLAGPAQPPILARAAAEGLMGLSLKDRRGALVKALREVLTEPDELARFFGSAEAVPAKITDKAIRARLDAVAKQRLILDMEANPPGAPRQTIEATDTRAIDRQAQVDAERRATAIENEIEQLERQLSRPGVRAREKAYLTRRLEQLENMREIERDKLEPLRESWVAGVDGLDRFEPEVPVRETYETTDDALADLREIDRRKAARDSNLSPTNAIDTPERAEDLLGEQARLQLDYDRATRNRTGKLDDETLTAEAVRARDALNDFNLLHGRDLGEWERKLDADARAADHLPYSGTRQSRGTPDNGDDEAILIDLDAIYRAFDQQPWTRPSQPGVNAMPADQFKTPEEFANFVFLHEREHTVNPRRPDETLADYENRINQRALDELAAGRLPLAPEGGLASKIAIAPLPVGQLSRLVPEDATIWEDILNLAGDGGIGTIGAHGGRAVGAGGSVFQRVNRWVARQVAFRHEVRAQWLAYLDRAPGTGKTTELRAIAARAGRAAQRQGKMTLPEFRIEVGRAINSPAADLLPEVAAAAKLWHVQMREFADAAESVGLFGRKLEAQRARVDQTIRNMEDVLARGRAFPERDLSRVEAMLEGLKARRAALDEQIDEPIMPKGETTYFHRIWHRGELERNRDAAIATFAEHFQSSRGLDAEDANREAVSMFEYITRDTEGAMMVPGSPTAAKHRAFDIPNEKAWPFMVQDPELVFSIYARRMGAAIEMTRRYGDPRGDDAAEALFADLLARGVPEGKAHRAMQIWHDARDRVAGGFHGRDPMSWDNRLVRAIKNFTNITLMGRGLYAQMNDAARMVGVVGNDPLMRAFQASLQGDLARFGGGIYAKAAGEALDLVLARTTARMIDQDDFLPVTRETFVERWLAQAQAPFFAMNGMMPFTIIMKEWASVASTHIVLEEASAIARALQAGGQADAAMVRRLANLGIDRNDAQLLASMPFDRTPEGLNVANIFAWQGPRGDRARDLLLGAISGDVRRAVTTPGPLERPAIMDGIFHTIKGREEALQRTDDARNASIEAYQALAELRRAQREGATVSDEQIDAALAALMDARKAFETERRGIGQAGRWEAPLLSLPFQLKSFVFSSSAKMVHGMLNARDRAPVAGLLSLMAAGYFSSWLANGGSWVDDALHRGDRGGRMQRMSWLEFHAAAFDRSGIGAWMADVGKQIEAVTHFASEDFRPNEMSNEIGAVAGAGAGVITQLAEGTIGTGLSGSALNDRERTTAIRSSLPFARVVWWDSIVRHLSEVNMEGAPPPPPPAYRDGPTWSERGLGLHAQDRRQLPQTPIETHQEFADPVDWDIAEMVRDYDPARRRRRRPRPPQPTRWEIANRPAYDEPADESDPLLN